MRFDPRHETNPVGRALLRRPALALALKVGYGYGAAALGNVLYREGVRKNDRTLRIAGRVLPAVVGGVGFALAIHNERTVPSR